MKSRLVRAFTSTRKTKSPPRRRASRRLGLQDLEARRLLAAVVVPGSEQTSGNHYQVSVVSTPEATLAGAPQSVSPAVARALEFAADLSHYTPQQLASAKQWVLQISPTNLAQASQRLGAAQLAPTGIIPDTYVYTPPANRTPQQVISQLRAIPQVSLFYPLAKVEVDTRAIPNDPYFPQQWHLLNSGQTGGTAGEDANVTPVWDSLRGAGVTIGIVDDGLFHTHPDLAANYDPSVSFDFVGNDADPTPPPTDSHGTSVAGVAAGVGFNGLGISGAAPEATIAGLRLLAVPLTDLLIAQVMSHRNDAIDIYNNSWGFPDVGILNPTAIYGGPLTVAAFENAVTNGRGGLGNIYTWAAGNGLQVSDNANYDTLANSRYTIAVTAIDHNGQQAFYAEPGAAILVAAHSQGSTVGITTTDNPGPGGSNSVPTAADGDPHPDLDYTSVFGGTSSATPLASGVIALLLEANPNLSYRDVQHILVQTARQNDPTDPDWTLNGAGFHVNHKYGFGAIDAQAIVAAAQGWNSVNPEFQVSTGALTPGLAIPDNNPAGLISTVTVNSPVELSLEHVEVRFTATHTLSSDLEVVLVSPAGTRSVLAESRTPLFAPGNYIDWSFDTVRNWGESINGTWTLEVRDLVTGNTGSVDDFELIFYGTEQDGEKIRGTKWNDIDRDGVRDPNEPGLAGFTIYVDLNNNAVRDANEPFAVTDANGQYVIDVSQTVQQFGFRDFVVREVEQFAYDQTFPVAGAPVAVQPPGSAVTGAGFYLVTIDQPDRVVSGVDFGNAGEPGEINGVKFFDENGNGVRDSGEAGQPGVTIQLFDDLGNLLQETVTGPDGSYQFADLTPRLYIVDEVVPQNQVKTLPTAAMGGDYRIDLQAAQIRVDIDFGNFGERGAISGRKFNDANGNGFHDNNELGVAGAVIYVDLNQNGIFNLGEPSEITDQFGFYELPDLVPGVYLVRELIPDGVIQTTPGGDGVQTVEVISGVETLGVDFGNRAFRDFGDAPAPYPTTLAQNGAVHGIRTGFFLGATVDAEDDGQPNATATGDDDPSSSFGTAVNFPVGVSPVSAAVGDLDGRFGPDLVVVNSVSSVDPTVGSVSVLFNFGNGVFSEAVEYLVGAQPSRVAIGDFDGVNGPDLAVTNTGSNTVSILLNQGDGSFAPAVNEPAGMQPRGVAVGDIDRDGDIDLAIANFGAATVSILLNDGTGAFDAPIPIAVNEGPVADVTLADIDRDNDLDLVTANSTRDTVSVLLNANVLVDDEPTFGNPLSFFVGDEPLSVIVADFNGDNRPDVATANRLGGNVSVLIGRGNGAFLPTRDFAVTGLPSSLAAIDIDNDGDRDIVVANRNAGQVALLVNDGNGNFTLGDSLLGGSIGAFVVAADFNLDGGGDVIVVNQTSNNVSLIAATGDDEDGVAFSPQPLVRGATALINVTASAPGILSAWIDYNLDGDWNDPGEQIFTDRQLTAGVNRLTITVPATANLGATFARFRFSDQTGLGPAGPATAGEVEDYQVVIAATGGLPTASFRNPQNALDVNADGMVTLFDALVLVNDLQTNGVRALPAVPPQGQLPPPFLDPSGDGFITLNDVLLVINGILAQMAQQGPTFSAIEGEGESAGTGGRGGWDAGAAFVGVDEEEDEMDEMLDAIAGDVNQAWSAK